MADIGRIMQAWAGTLTDLPVLTEEQFQEQHPGEALGRLCYKNHIFSDH